MQSQAGAENSMGGISQAFADNIPVLVIPGAPPLNQLSVRPNFNATSNYQSAGYLYFYRLGNPQTYSFYTGQTCGAFDMEFKFVSGSLPQTSTVDQIKFIASGVSFSMSASLYGVKNA